MLSDSTTFLEHVSNHLVDTGILWIGLLVLLLPVIARFLGARVWLALGIVCTVLLIGLTSYHGAAEGWRLTSRPECLWGSALKGAKEFGVLYSVPVAASMVATSYLRKLKLPLLIELGGVALTAFVVLFPAVWVSLFIQYRGDWCLTR